MKVNPNQAKGQGNWDKNDFAFALTKLSHKTTARFLIWCLTHKMIPNKTVLDMYLMNERGIQLDYSEINR